MPTSALKHRAKRTTRSQDPKSHQHTSSLQHYFPHISGSFATIPTLFVASYPPDFCLRLRSKTAPNGPPVPEIQKATYTPPRSSTISLISSPILSRFLRSLWRLTHLIYAYVCAKTPRQTDHPFPRSKKPPAPLLAPALFPPYLWQFCDDFYALWGVLLT